MKLTRTERLILSNQYRILEGLYPKEAREHQRARVSLEEGYEQEYIFLAEHVREDVMTVEECKELYEILEMHRAMKFSYRELSDKSGITEGDVDFAGFDGNDAVEGKYLSYVRYVSEARKYEELERGDDFNSHSPELDRYRKMLAAWRGMGKERNLSKDRLRLLSSTRA